MTVTTVARHRTRKSTFGRFWLVDIRTVLGMWHVVGSVGQESPDENWNASHRSRPLGYYATKREAVQAVVAAEAGQS